MTKKQYDKIMDKCYPFKESHQAWCKLRSIIIREIRNNWALLIVLYLVVIMVVPPILKSIWGIE